MKVLILSESVMPLMSPRANRTIELARELSRRGHEVVVYALLGDYDYKKEFIETGVKYCDYGHVKLYRMNSNGPRPVSFIEKCILTITEQLVAFPSLEIKKHIYSAIKREKFSDCIITIAMPFIIPWSVASFKKRYGNKYFNTWISDCGDPFMGNPLIHAPFYFKYIEKDWCRLTDYITVPVEGVELAYYREFRNKIHIIPQGFDFSHVNLMEYKPNEVPTFAYAGVVYKGFRDPSLFLDFLCAVEKPFKFIVFTGTKKIFDEYRERLGDKIEIRDSIPRNELLYFLSGMDFVINIKNENQTRQTPSKLIDYGLVKRPILQVSSSFPIEERNMFLDFCEGIYDGALDVLGIERYDIRVVTDQFENLMV